MASTDGTENATDNGQAVEAVRIEIALLDLRPGDLLAMICPEGWTPQQMVMMGDHVNASGVLPEDVRIICFPHGTELAVIGPADLGPNLGFGEREP